MDGLIEHTARSKVEAVGSVTGSLDRLTADLAALGAVPFDEGAGRRPLTWLAYSSATREESYHDKETGRLERTGRRPPRWRCRLPSGTWTGWMISAAYWRLTRA